MHEQFFKRLKTFETAEASAEKVNKIVSGYLNNTPESKILLPESIQKVLHTGEKPFKFPPKDKVAEAVKAEADKLVRIQLADLAQDDVLLKMVNGYEIGNVDFSFSEEEQKKLSYIQGEINFALKAEMAKTNPKILEMKDEEIEIAEPRNEEAIAKNSAIVNAFLKEVEDARAGDEYSDLDLKETFVPPYEPKIDPLSFVHGLVAQNLFTVDVIPVLNENAEITGMTEVWGQPVDPKAVANSMKHGTPDTSGTHQMKGNGLEVPLGANSNNESVAPGSTEDDFEEIRYVDLKVILEIDNNLPGRWPQIAENIPSAKVEASETPPPAPAKFTDVFEMMNYITAIPESKTATSDAVDDSEDISAFKKKRKPKKIEEIISPEVLSQTQAFQPEEQITTVSAATSKPKKGIDGYEFAEMLDVRSNVSEYHKMKNNLARTYPFELDPFQQQAIVAMENGHSVFVAAHTSAGKTVVAEYAIALSRKHRSRVVYTSPIKALSNQKFRDFRNQFEDVGLVTGDIQLNSDASCLIMTTEILKSMLYNGRVSPDELEWVIFDEVHYINDLERGHVWEEVLIMLPHQVNIVMLSATVPNCLEFADWVGRIKNRKIYVVQTLHRPVPLAHHLYSGKDKKSQNNLFEIMGRQSDGKFNMRGYAKAKEAQIAQWSQKKGGPIQNTNKTYFSKAVDRCHYQTLIAFLKEKNLLPAVSFIFSRNRCNQYAEMLYQIDLTTNDEKAAVRKLFTKYLDSFKGSDRNLPQVLQMQQLCYRGFAIHHSGILPILKELVEILFQLGYVKFLFATETFAMGVNMPARTVVFDSIDKFDGTTRRPLNCTEYIQMAGRAGRRGIDDTGVVIILSKGSGPHDHTTLLTMLQGKAISLESKFRITYNMLLNIIRAEQLNIEDMLQRSYVERVSLRLIESRKEKIAEVKEKIEALPALTCSDCTQVEYGASIDHYYSSLMTYIYQRGNLMNRLITLYGAGNKIIAGRYLLISYPQKNIACMLVCVHSITNSKDAKELDVVTLETSSVEKAEYDSLSEDEKAKVKNELLFEHAVKHGLEILIDNGQSTDKLELIRNVSFENIIGICKAKAKNYNVKEISDYFIQKSSVNNRRQYPSRFISNFMTEMDMVMKANIQRQDDNFIYKIGEDLTSKDLEINDEIYQFAQLRKNLLDNNKYLCRQCLDFDAHIHMIHERQLLETEYDHLKYQTSFGALTLTDDYSNCLKVLQHLNFIDKDNLITIKGRVAAQINEDTLLLTEMIFENKLQNRGCSEIAALLCPLTAQHHSAKEKQNERDCKILTTVANIDVINTLKEEMANMANKIDDIERKCKVVNARRDPPTFGLMEAVYQWAEGMSFEQITHLTDAHEGIIVRCIQRLDEVLKDIRNAGRIIGDNALVQKMVDTSAAIRRDIVFAASLYTADD
uniref:Helicase SKI2W n=1 Tax=Panagrolaimus sp. ES5 TaxID=591445 RepID=A0AC34GPJ4_9BILA